MIGCFHKEELDMTIKEFAKLCNCSTQTLRYYDSINLFKPARVDRFTGYRCYNEEQALTFVKIKNLQDASFSIEEIKGLLTKREEDIYLAFEAKIAEQEEKLQKIKQIQMSYRKEYMEMQETIKAYQESLTKSAKQYDAAVEFGISEAYYDEIINRTNDYVEMALNNMQKVQNIAGLCKNAPDPDAAIRDFDEGETASNPLEDSDNTVIYEQHKWEHVKDALAGMPELAGENCFYFKLRRERLKNMAFPTVVLALALDKNEGKELSLTCHCVPSEDDENHFWILKRNA